MRVGIADHFGWAVAVSASDAYEVVDRRRIELVEPGVTEAPIHYESKHLDVAANCGPRRRGPRVGARATSAALDELAASLPGPIASISLRTLPAEFPTDIARAAAVAVRGPRRCGHVPAGARRAARTTPLGGPLLRGEGRARAGGDGARGPNRGGARRSARRARAAVDEGPPGGVGGDGRRRLTVRVDSRAPPAAVEEASCAPPARDAGSCRSELRASTLEVRRRWRCGTLRSRARRSCARCSRRRAVAARPAAADCTGRTVSSSINRGDRHLFEHDARRRSRSGTRHRRSAPRA